MRCEQIREQFHSLDEPPEHVHGCSECRAEWDLHFALREFRVPELDHRFNARVLAELDRRELFSAVPKSAMERLATFLSKVLPPIAVLACLLLLLWMGNLAGVRPGPELRALEPERAKMWSSLPDAVPPPALPGPAPTRQQMRLVKGDEQ